MQYFFKKNYMILGVLSLLYMHVIFSYDFNVLLGLNLPCVIKIYISFIITFVNSCMMCHAPTRKGRHVATATCP